MLLPKPASLPLPTLDLPVYQAEPSATSLGTYPRFSCQPESPPSRVGWTNPPYTLECPQPAYPSAPPDSTSFSRAHDRPPPRGCPSSGAVPPSVARARFLDVFVHPDAVPSSSPPSVPEPVMLRLLLRLTGDAVPSAKPSEHASSSSVFLRLSGGLGDSADKDEGALGCQDGAAVLAEPSVAGTGVGFPALLWSGDFCVVAVTSSTRSLGAETGERVGGRRGEQSPAVGGAWAGTVLATLSRRDFGILFPFAALSRRLRSRSSFLRSSLSRLSRTKPSKKSTILSNAIVRDIWASAAALSHLVSFLDTRGSLESVSKDLQLGSPQIGSSVISVIIKRQTLNQAPSNSSTRLSLRSSRVLDRGGPRVKAGVERGKEIGRMHLELPPWPPPVSLEAVIWCRKNPVHGWRNPSFVLGRRVAGIPCRLACAQATMALVG
ncbi:hypothetical protein B0J18DRAFT_420638 [Chaetomium sp. MPI-SDFR-AT-0129]|nr:hypothetical protein B0J18DRAFT_420638 [Chaetomium sp. MPI-SDFR-AT-0129]